jgi:hypothetical protein
MPIPGIPGATHLIHSVDGITVDAYLGIVTLDHREAEAGRDLPSFDIDHHLVAPHERWRPGRVVIGLHKSPRRPETVAGEQVG